MNQPLCLITSALIMCAATTCTVFAADDPVLVSSPHVAITRADYQAELLRLPEDLRGSFGTNPQRIRKLLNSMLVTRTLAQDARDEGLDKDPQTQKLLTLQLDKFLAQLHVERLDKQWSAEFDKDRERYVSHAKELYEIDKEQYRIPEEIRASHILIKVGDHSKEEALKRAQSIRERALKGEDFAMLADENSEDPSVKTNHGDLGYFVASRMDPEFSKAAFALKKAGDISEPVLSSFGYHVVRLVDRKASTLRGFEEVKNEIMARLRQKHIEEQRAKKLSEILSDKVTVNDAAIDALKEPIIPIPAPAQEHKEGGAK